MFYALDCSLYWFQRVLNHHAHDIEIFNYLESTFETEKVFDLVLEMQYEKMSDLKSTVFFELQKRQGLGNLIYLKERYSNTLR